MPLSANLEEAGKTAAMSAAANHELGAAGSSGSRGSIWQRVSSALGQRVVSHSGKITPTWAGESSESSDDDEAPPAPAGPHQMFSSRGRGGNRRSSVWLAAEGSEGSMDSVAAVGV